jgi:transcriptional regulator with XRE-family HTH domain
MSITIKDVAKEAGVSVATVSRVLNGSCNVSDESTKKVNENNVSKYILVVAPVTTPTVVREQRSYVYTSLKI